jgi:hypothetical protein
VQSWGGLITWGKHHGPFGLAATMTRIGNLAVADPSHQGTETGQ